MGSDSGFLHTAESEPWQNFIDPILHPPHLRFISAALPGASAVPLLGGKEAGSNLRADHHPGQGMGVDGILTLIF